LEGETSRNPSGETTGGGKIILVNRTRGLEEEKKKKKGGEEKRITLWGKSPTAIFSKNQEGKDRGRPIENDLVAKKKRKRGDQ